ncbi:MAG: hypothetical protein II851_09120 [Bacteroidales bacterium]|nr:hypothetical protein [Bacteroidales bacterium]
MKYIVRVLKYFVLVTVVMALLLLVLALLGYVEKDVDSMFRNGWKSIWQIALMFLVVAAIYPRFGFCKRGAIVPGAYEDIRPGLVRYMAGRGYEIEKEEGENLSFRLKSPLQRFLRLLFEDRITFTRDRAGFYVEGRTKDVVRIVSGLEALFNGSRTDN